MRLDKLKPFCNLNCTCTHLQNVGLDNDTILLNYSITHAKKLSLFLNIQNIPFWIEQNNVQGFCQRFCTVPWTPSIFCITKLSYYSISHNLQCTCITLIVYMLRVIYLPCTMHPTNQFLATCTYNRGCKKASSFVKQESRKIKIAH